MKRETILVTGGAGYIGLHAVNALLSSGRKVIVVDWNEQSCDLLRKTFSRRKKQPEVYCADIDNDVYINGILKNEKPDAVMHFASSISVPESIRNPLLYYTNNTAKTIRLVDRMIRNGVYRLICSSTAAVYGSPENNEPLQENTLCKPINAYGQSKLMIEHILKKTSQTIPAFKYTSFRYFNVAGSNIDGKIRDPQWRSKGNVIPKFLSAVLDGKPHLEIYGTDYDTPDGTCIRDYIHVDDIISAHMIALDSKIEGVYNLGSSEGSSVWNVVEKTVAVTNTEIDVIHKPRREGDPSILIADSSRFRELTNWEPTYTLKEMIASAWKAYSK
jgi:UDP-glucose 4-epimerase